MPGLNQFYNGVLHPLLAAAHLVSLLALALLGGQQALRPRPWEIIGLALGLALGAAGAHSLGDPDTDRWLWALALAGGGLVALARPLPAVLRGLLGAAIGVAIGLGSADTALQGTARVSALLGALLGALLLVAYASLGVERLMRWRQHPPVAIGLRVLGSWLAACALLMLALAFKRAG